MMKTSCVYRHQSARGFTLIELMIVVVIAAIIAAVAVPSYQTSIRKSRRSDAVVALGTVQLLQEKYRANNTSYGTLAQVGGTTPSSGGYYTISVSSYTATGFVLTAAAVAGSSQAADTDCATMTLTQSGETVTYGPATTCWR